MKVRKLKYVRKCLTFYKSYFGFVPPYRLVVDGTFCKAALDSQINIRDQINAYLDDSEIIIHSTPCVKKECDMFGE